MSYSDGSVTFRNPFEPILAFFFNFLIFLFGGSSVTHNPI